jgi:glyoxylase-like metal-dependent hydrolase (beta-lactamase superfamily II)
MRAMRELRPGLWHWQAPHPEWYDDADWSRDVSSYALDDGARLLLFDPLAVPEELLGLSTGRDTAIVLTSPWHERDAESLVKRLGAPVYTPRPDSAQDLIDKYGITAEEAGDGSPDLRWLRDGGGDARWYASGDRLPFGAEAFAGREPNDVVLWLESPSAVLAGDSLADFGSGIAIQTEWVGKGDTRENVAARLRPLLDHPVELILPTHGEPTDRAALERALA